MERALMRLSTPAGTVHSGSCARGEIMFSIPQDQHPTSVVYLSDSYLGPTYWTVPAR